MTTLFMQVLGNNDVLFNGKQGIDALRGYSLEEVDYYAKSVTEEALENINRVDFPLIKRLRETYTQEESIFLILLTDQHEWIEARSIEGEAWREIIASDGIWWQEVLKEWCKCNKIQCYPIVVTVSPTIPNGCADWEGIASLIDRKFNNIFQLTTETITFTPDYNNHIPIDKVIIQHSSGTPALSSAIYLWGIEQKLGNKPVEFVYLSVQNNPPFQHSGNHWQWRLKVPQIEQLLAIQDFSGIRQLINDQGVDDLVKKLDRAVSFNLLNTPRSPEDDVIERIAIAKWSELAFRKRVQWMHWYLRIAGAFELVIQCLVAAQGDGQYQWKRNESDKKVFLCYKDQHNLSKVSISQIVNLLTNGSCKDNKINYEVKLINDPMWNDFKQFYCEDGWHLSSNINKGFTKIRNELYHSLTGDIVDEELDKKTIELGNVQDERHPSQQVIKWFEYIIELANLKQKIEERIAFYVNLLDELKQAINDLN